MFDFHKHRKECSICQGFYETIDNDMGWDKFIQTLQLITELAAELEKGAVNES